MQVIESATIVCRSMGEKNMVVLENENTGVTLTLENAKGIELELGFVGRVIYNETANQLISFEPAMQEELVF